ncbi:MAG: hypothetical protein AMXMBFR76_03960 [Pseudomonadota bacterium]
MVPHQDIEHILGADPVGVWLLRADQTLDFGIQHLAAHSLLAQQLGRHRDQAWNEGVTGLGTIRRRGTRRLEQWVQEIRRPTTGSVTIRLTDRNAGDAAATADRQQKRSAQQAPQTILLDHPKFPSRKSRKRPIEPVLILFANIIVQNVGADSKAAMPFSPVADAIPQWKP